MSQQVVLVSSSEDGNITSWDVATGTQLASYKHNACSPNCLSLLGTDYLIAAQSSKGSIHAWTWHKDALHLRSFAPEPMLALAGSGDGALVVGGGVSGALYVWEAPSGRLLRSWPAHYKSVSSLAFDSTQNVLVSGGEDTVVSVWLLPEVLDKNAGRFQIGGGAGVSVPKPLHSWNEHTLPIRALAVGCGGSRSIVISGGEDRRILIHSLGNGVVLRSVALPFPITSLSLDGWEHAVYAGTVDGAIVEVSLVTHEETHAVLEGHRQAIHTLAMTGDGAQLVSGSEDGSVRIWDLRSRQTIKVLDAPVKGPVSGIMVIDKPEAMPGLGGVKHIPGRLQPLAPLSKYPGTSGSVKPWEGPPVLLHVGKRRSKPACNTSALSPAELKVVDYHIDAASGHARGIERPNNGPPPSPQLISEWASRIQDAEREIRESKFYQNLLNTVYTFHVFDHVRQIVMYGLGSLIRLGASHVRYQFALMVLIRKTLSPNISWIAYDPVFTTLDKAILRHYGCETLEENEGGRRLAVSPMLFYMPHCEGDLTEALLQCNVSGGTLQNVYILGNAISKYVDGQYSHQTMTTLSHGNRLAEKRIPEENFPVTSAFNDIALHTFFF